MDTELVPIGTDEADLTGADPVVDPVLIALRRCYDVTLLCKGCGLPGVRGEARTRPRALGSSGPGRTLGGRVGVAPTSRQLSPPGNPGSPRRLTVVSPEADEHDDDAIREAAAALEEARERLASVPPEVVVTNHVMGLYELAAIHLSSEPVDLVSAALAIDAVGCLVEGLGPRLGEEHQTMVDALANIRMAFVQVKAATGAPD